MPDCVLNPQCHAAPVFVALVAIRAKWVSAFTACAAAISNNLLRFLATVIL